ncbi:hypothetical protein [Enemella sp. A6]|uniref:hypothetical protein n=1 Tax=Enemella sp. A6 TaxID=3440152 RepID=UPI003EB75B75
MAPHRIVALASAVAWIVALVTPLTGNTITGPTRTHDMIVEMPPLSAFLAIPFAMALMVASARPRLWLFLVAIALGAILTSLLLVMPMGHVLWDGMDANGNPIGGMAEDTRDVGWFAALAGALLLSFAGAIGVRSNQKPANKNAGIPTE